MSDIESPIGKVPVRGKPLPTYRVDDLSQSSPVQQSSDPFEERKRLIAAKRREMIERMKGEGEAIRSNNEEQYEEKTMTIEASSDEIPKYNLGGDKPKMIGNSEEIQKMEKLFELKNFADKIDPENKKRIETLLNLGVRRKVIEIDGHKIGIRSLPNKLVKQALRTTFLYLETADSDTVKRLESNFLMRNITLSYCLESIDGMLITDIFEDETSDIARLSLIEGMDEDVLDIISKEYDKLSGKNAQLKTKEDAEEVVQEIKK